MGKKTMPKARNEVEVEAHWGKMSSSYNDQMNTYCQQRFIRIIKQYANGRILDVGCGTGYVQDHLGQSSIGMDLTLGLLRSNKNNPVCANAEVLPFKDEVFDLVYSINLLEHVQSPERVIRECKRVLKKKGVLILITPNKGMELALDAAERLNLKIPEGPHRFLYPAEIKTFIENNGMESLFAGKMILFPKEMGGVSKMFERMELMLQGLCMLQFSISRKNG